MIVTPIQSKWNRAQVVIPSTWQILFFFTRQVSNTSSLWLIEVNRCQIQRWIFCFTLYHCSASWWLCNNLHQRSRSCGAVAKRRFEEINTLAPCCLRSPRIWNKTTAHSAWLGKFSFILLNKTLCSDLFFKICFHSEPRCLQKTQPLAISVLLDVLAATELTFEAILSFR